MSIKIKTILIIASLLTAVSTFAAQQKVDTTYTFRFVPQKDMFYVPLDGNDRELARLLECVRRNKDSILGGSLPLYVDGYSNSLDSEKENLRMAAIRSNRVKSELIVRGGIKEECFITRNHASDGDFVIVRLTVPAPEASIVESKAEEERLAAERAEQERKAAEERRKAEEARRAAEKAEADRLAKEQAARKAEQPQEITATPLESPSSAPYHLPCVPICCVGLHSPPTWVWSGASIPRGESS